MELKPQDLLFLGALVILFLKRDPKFFVIAGLICLVLTIPLFHQWIFFTAQRLIMYAFAFLFIAAVLNLAKLRHNK